VIYKFNILALNTKTLVLFSNSIFQVAFKINMLALDKFLLAKLLAKLLGKRKIGAKKML